MAGLSTTTCCGVRDYTGLMATKSCEQALFEVFSQWMSMKGAFIMLSCPTDKQQLSKLKLYITKNKLGTAHLTEARYNPNSGHMLRVMMWGVNKKEYIRWFNRVTTKRDKQRQIDLKKGKLVVGQKVIGTEFITVELQKKTGEIMSESNGLFRVRFQMDRGIYDYACRANQIKVA